MTLLVVVVVVVELGLVEEMVVGWKWRGKIPMMMECFLLQSFQ